MVQGGLGRSPCHIFEVSHSRRRPSRSINTPTRIASSSRAPFFECPLPLGAKLTATMAVICTWQGESPDGKIIGEHLHVQVNHALQDDGHVPAVLNDAQLEELLMKPQSSTKRRQGQGQEGCGHPTMNVFPPCFFVFIVFLF
ncbi:hypothetical protein G6O67_006220 [Ophiocordyceps sinensis]|uniref:Uncharacterized protein n=1 Tax=Ophiocordyceps sinensis TaxID=72228 RepID=A0A8H4LVS7_9HYPO|nr:hypothetical protein G6O67_006220 [Ophiocordyceps sinensis]